MESEWAEVPLGEMITLQRGFDLPSQNRKPGKVPIVSSSGISDFHSEAAVKGPGVVTGRYGTIGQVFLIREDYWPLNTTLWVKDFHGNDPYCVSYLLRSVDFQSCSDKSSVPGVNRNDLHRLPILLPPLAEQRAIAGVLGALDDKIELNRRMNATLESMARALFQSWFVDFDPVRAKLDGRQPAELDPETAALFPDSFEDSELGAIPQGWKVCPLSENIELLSGGTPKTSEPLYWDGDIPWYSVKDAPSETDVWVIQTEKLVTTAGIANSATQVLPEGATIISARGTVGKLALIGTPMAMNQSCYGVRGIAGYGEYFTYFALRQATAELRQRTHGTVFDTITRQTFDTLDCIFPPANLTRAFDRTVAPLLAQIRANLYQSRTLATLRDALLPKLLSGELSVAGAESLMENA
jgi:type I restriction enzyme S subunit